MDLIELAEKPFMVAMLAAVEACKHPVDEEGGIILAKEGECVFVKVKNVYAGSDAAAGLYETDQTELQEKVLTKVVDGWKFHASFHTHPQWMPNPSRLDMEKLFQGFKHNVIFAPTTNMFSYTRWIDEKHSTYYIPKQTLEKLIKE